MFKKLALTLVATLLIAGCSNSATPSPTNTSPSPTPSITVPEDLKDVVLYFVADTPKGFRLFSEVQQLPVSSDLELVITGLVTGALQPVDPDYSNLWGVESAVNSVAVTTDLITIDLAAVDLNVGSEAESRAIGQVVWTATEIAGDLPVRFLLNGAEVETLAGHVDTSEAIERGETYVELSDVQLVAPESGATVTSPVTASGFACTFEANVAWQLVRDGSVIDQGSTLAAEACPTRSSFAVELGELESGIYTLKVMEYSAKDGKLSSMDTKTFMVE
ncbi:MAG: hypothetical protein RL038_492 [Actinomycetota bacterium]